MKNLIALTAATLIATPALAHSSSFLHSHTAELLGLAALGMVGLAALALWARK